MAVQRLSNSGRSGFSYKSLIAGITPLPSVPTIGAATAVTFSSVNVAFTAPGAYAGSTYTATSSPGGLTGTSATSPILVSGLSELTAYTFTVTATNATGTSGASAASSPVTTPVGDNGVMFPLGMVSVGSGGSSTITFSSIPATFTHLQLRVFARTNRTSQDFANLLIRFNNDTGSNYAYHDLFADGATVTASGTATQTSIIANRLTGAGAAASIFGAIIVDVLDYTSTNKNKTVRALGGVDLNGSGALSYSSGLYFATPAAINRIDLTTIAGTFDFVQYSTFALYGIKGA